MRGYITGSGWKDYQRTGDDLRASSCRRACRSPSSCPSRSSRRRRRPRRATTRTIDFEQTAELVGDRALAERLRDVSIAVYERGRRARPRARRHPRRHEVRVRARRGRRARARRRGLHAGLLALLARRRLRAGPRASRPSTSSTCATGRPAPAGTRRRPRRRSPTTSSPRRASATSSAYELLAGEPFSAWLERVGARRVRARVLIRPKAGILDPQGQTVERALPALGFDGRLQRPRRPPDRARRRGPVAAAGDVRAAAGQPADRGLRDRPERPAGVKFGVVRFPGSCDERDALLRRAARRRGRDPLARRPRPQRRRRRDRPGRLLLRRPPARRRDRPLLAVMARGRALRAARAARCSASATASRSSARRACCRARCCRTPRCASPAPDRRRGRADRTAVDARVRAGRPALDPGQAHDRPLLRARAGARRDARRTARSCCATPPATTRTARSTTIAGVCERGRQRARPDAASRARGRPADRLGRRAAAVRVASRSRRRR